MLGGRSRNINARRRSRSALKFVSAQQHVLISHNLPVRKSYFDSNIIYKAQKCKDIAPFFLGIISKRTSTEAHIYMQRHQGVKVEHFDVSNVIYHKFSHRGVSYTLSGENVNVMLECHFKCQLVTFFKMAELQ